MHTFTITRMPATRAKAPITFGRTGDNSPAIPRLPRPRKPHPDSVAGNHPGDSDPNPDEALRRARIGAGR